MAKLETFTSFEEADIGFTFPKTLIDGVEYGDTTFQWDWPSGDVWMKEWNIGEARWGQVVLPLAEAMERLEVLRGHYTSITKPSCICLRSGTNGAHHV